MKFIGVANDIFDKENLHYITIFMRVETDENEISVKEPERMEQIGWFDPKDLPNPLFLPVKNLLKDLRLEK